MRKVLNYSFLFNVLIYILSAILLPSDVLGIDLPENSSIDLECVENIALFDED